MKEQVLTISKKVALSMMKTFVFACFVSFIGLVINIMALVYLHPEIKYLVSLTMQDESFPAMKASDPLSVLIILVLFIYFLFRFMWPGVLVYVFFGVCFPVAYFMTAKSYFFQLELRKILVSQQDWIASVIFHQLKSSLAKIQSFSAGQGVQNKVQQAMQSLQGGQFASWPRPLRWGFKHLLKKIDVSSLMAVVKTEDKSLGSPEGEGGELKVADPSALDGATGLNIIASVKQQSKDDQTKKAIAHFLLKKLETPSLNSLWFLLASNVAIVILLKIFL